MVMRSIPELLNDSSSHVSIAVARHFKESSPPPSSSSDSDADVDELPFVPMPLSMVFSGSRVSINEIPGDEDVAGCSSVFADATRKKDSIDVTGARGVASKRAKNEVETPNEERTEKTTQIPLKKGSSVESDNSEIKAKRATMRRGSSADSALLLHIDPEEANANEDSEASNKSLKKAVSMELPNRSPSPGAAKLSQEDYALKLELMRQRLLRGASMDKKMSGLRGPLFETLGMDEERQTVSLDRNLRRSRLGPSSLTRAASSDSPGEDTPKTKVFRKSSSFTQGDSEPMPLHRRFGAPLEIPSVGSDSVEGKKLQEATSMSALTEQTEESMCASVAERETFITPSPRVTTEKITQIVKADKVDSESRSHSIITPIIVIEEDDEKQEKKENQELINNIEKNLKGNEEVRPNSRLSSLHERATGAVPSQSSDEVQSKDPFTIAKSATSPSPEHPAVFSRVAAAAQPPGTVSTSSNPDVPVAPRQPVLRTDIKDIDSEEVFEARFKKRESSLTRGLRKLTRNKSEEKSPVLNRKNVDRGEEVYRPGPRGAPLEMISKGLQEKSKSVQDLREEDKDTGLSLIGRFSLRGRRSTSIEKKGEKPKEEKHQDVQSAAVSKRVSWAFGRSKSLDTGAQKQPDDTEHQKAEESSVSAMRRKFESKVAGISGKIRTQSEERKDKDAQGSQKDVKKVTDSPILAMRQRFENKVAGISSKIRSQSEERKGDEERTRTPLFTRHRHSQSEGRGLKGMDLPENQLAKQTGTGASKESVESTSSIHSEKASESDRRSRWDRWGLTRGRKDKAPSQSDLPSSIHKEDGSSKTQQFILSASDFAPVFHIKLKDQILLEGEPVILSCLPAGSPHPVITWMKGIVFKLFGIIVFFFLKPAGQLLKILCLSDRKALEVDDRIHLISHPDGRQLLKITKSTRKDAGIYECLATNPIANTTTSCILSIACK